MYEAARYENFLRLSYYYASNVFNQNYFLFHYIYFVFTLLCAVVVCDMMPERKKCLNFVLEIVQMIAR